MRAGTHSDVAVDLRRGSPTYARWEAVELDDEHMRELYVPVGFAHGFCVLSDVADVLYKQTAYYDPALERAIAWNDPDVGIQWPFPAEELVVSERDAVAPMLREVADETALPLASMMPRLRAMSREARLTALAILAFLGISVWWLTQETRTPDFDSATHTLYSFTVHNEIANGEWGALFREWNTYPPLGHVIGAIGVFIGGFSTFAVILALNLVFVPLLAVSCYGVGRLVAGPRAGLLAAIFALGTPMIVSEAHEAYMDPTQAAFVAAAVWGILASRRFERWGIAALEVSRRDWR